jgi:hypothetical protein
MAGEPRFVALSAMVDARQAFDANAATTEGSAISFCAEQGDRADLQVEVHGSTGSWLLALWKVADLGPGEARW